MTQTVVTGATGRMGRRLIALIHGDPNCHLAGAVTRAAHDAIGRDAGEIAGVGTLNVPVSANLADIVVKADVIIDFSVPEASLNYLRLAREAGVAMVIGTTGFSAAERESIVDHSRYIPCVMAPNMSLGVQVMFQLLQQAAALLGSGYDIEILEAHHRTKVDAPSGTAVRMGEILAEARQQTLDAAGVYGRQGQVGVRSDTEIGMHAIRGGDIVGEHTVIFAGTGERIELIHRSQSRDNFVQGAIRAAQWLVTQSPGLYGMEDVIRAE
ncbi:4-hydroxy-tetrahydrodipicolinate reductase [Candidatus Entotheonella palauensis]|uniref:4-hydroxy-tetrahydrodipicolinate reductase n=1 Tax=Candidatus Entotheonella palauensis TaxID=93172 RepID=UPI000B7EB399|nr:4-hydroxy-tetrahydrodipicolinate reductase [Candidatus Entotheonella palauensis]